MPVSDALHADLEVVINVKDFQASFCMKGTVQGGPRAETRCTDKGSELKGLHFSVGACRDLVAC